MRVNGPFRLHDHFRNEEQGYELFFDWDESFADLGLTITKIIDTEHGPGAALYMTLSRDEARVLHDYLYGCLQYRPRPEGH